MAPLVTWKARASRAEKSRATVQYFAPSYSLYPVLADIHGARRNAVRLWPDFALPGWPLLEKSRAWDFAAALTLVTTPNAPSGPSTRWSRATSPSAPTTWPT